MVKAVPLFSYKHGSSPLHRLDARIKLLLIFAAGYAVLSLPSVPCVVCIAAVSAISTVSGFTFGEQLTQLKPAAYYAGLLYTVSLISSFAEHIPFPSLLVPQSADILLSLRLALAVQFTGLLYRTTSPLALRTALEQIEDAFRNFFHLKSPGHNTIPGFSETFSLLLVFIPQVFDVWQEVSRAWKARNGRGGIRMLSALFPVFISVCMKHSYLMSLALRNRRQ
ncbi:MAG TPA: hypothetical protein DCL73_02890 [Treponema sp.]|nr:hypothetical protein [Treponema sp.]